MNQGLNHPLLIAGFFMLYPSRLRSALNSCGGIVLMCHQHVLVAPLPPFSYAETNVRRIKQKILQTNEMTAFLIRIDRETEKHSSV